MSHADDTDRLQLKRLITEAEKAGTVVQIPSIVARQFLEDSEWIAGQAALIQRLNECVAELERLYAARCCENDRFRAGLERTRDRFPFGGCSGSHLGAVRRWMRSTFSNGERIIWRSDDELANTGMTVRQMEQLAHQIKDAVIGEVLRCFGIEQLRSTSEQQDAMCGGDSADTGGQ